MMAAIVPLLCSTVAPRAAVARWLSHRSAIHNLHCLAATTDRAVDLAERACSPEPPQFTAVRDETQERWPGGAHMVSGMQQGRLLHMLVRLSRATRVLEVGCFSGYAALWMALALPEGGKLVSLERDERAADVARRHLDASGVGERVDLVLGDAMESLHALPEHDAPFDLVFLDADKKRSGQARQPYTHTRARAPPLGMTPPAR